MYIVFRLAISEGICNTSGTIQTTTTSEYTVYYTRNILQVSYNLNYPRRAAPFIHLQVCQEFNSGICLLLILTGTKIQNA